MRILVVSQYFWPENFRVNDLVSELGQRGHQVTVLTGLPNYPDGDVFSAYRSAPADFAQFAGASVVRVPLVARGHSKLRLAANYASFALSGALLGTWRVKDRGFDVIFVFQPSPITACIPALAVSRVTGAPVMLWVLDLWPDSLAAVGAVRRPWLLAIVGIVVRLIYRGCAMILGQSEAFTKSIEQYAGIAARVRYFPNWVEPQFVDHDEVVTAAEEVRHLAGKFNIVFAGNVGEAQDLHTVLRAVESLRAYDEIRWVIVGDGRAASNVRAEIARLGLEKSVLMVGRHAVERMPSFFRIASACLVSLRRDRTLALTIPGKLQTYLAMGLPVVAMLDGEGARVVRESGGGVVCASGDSAALTKAVLELLSMTPDERTAMGERGRAYCRREYDRTALMDKLEDWMRECAESARTP